MPGCCKLCYFNLRLPPEVHSTPIQCEDLKGIANVVVKASDLRYAYQRFKFATLYEFGHLCTVLICRDWQLAYLDKS